MTSSILYMLAGIVLFGTGLHALILHKHLLRKIIAANVMGAGVFLFLVAVAARVASMTPDPVPHAMVLTGIVITVSTTAFALALAGRLRAETGKARLPDDGSTRE